jgi:hypothetical protein
MYINKVNHEIENLATNKRSWLEIISKDTTKFRRKAQGDPISIHLETFAQAGHPVRDGVACGESSLLAYRAERVGGWRSDDSAVSSLDQPNCASCFNVDVNSDHVGRREKATANRWPFKLQQGYFSH